MVDHVDLPEAQLHEPKNLISATSSDAGKVLTPSSTDGESELRKLKVTELNSESNTDGAFAVADGSGGMTFAAVAGLKVGVTKYVGAAITTTISASSTFTSLNTSSMATGVLNGVASDSTGELTAPDTGIYHVKAEVSGHLSAGTNEEIELAIGVNGSQSGFSTQQLVSGSDKQTFDVEDIFSLTASDTLEIMIANNTGTNNFDHYTAQLIITKLADA